MRLSNFHHILPRDYQTFTAYFLEPDTTGSRPKI